MRWTILATTTLLLGTAALALTGPVQASQYKVLYTFCQKANCTDGQTPEAGVVADANGNLFGTTQGGGLGYQGDHKDGVIYELAWDSSAKKYTYKKLWDFCGLDACADGAQPNGELIVDTAGNLYGTTTLGGTGGVGTIFQLTASGKLNVLYTFCADQNVGCANHLVQDYAGGKLTYAGQSSGQLYDGQSAFYGTLSTSYSQATQNGKGAVWEMRPTKHGQWVKRDIYQFCPNGQGGTQCPDGAVPLGGVTYDDGTGHIYGTTQAGGTAQNGVLFELAKKNGSWTETLLHTFCTDHSTSACTDGGQPWAAPTIYGGALYGSASIGGPNSGAQGTIYKVTHPGNPRYKVIGVICPNGNCSNGYSSSSTVVLDAAGDVFGATNDQGGGFYGLGTLVEITVGTKKAVDIHDFDGTHGALPGGDQFGTSLLMLSDGSFVGTTPHGGKTAQSCAYGGGGCGVVYQMMP